MATASKSGYRFLGLGSWNIWVGFSPAEFTSHSWNEEEYFSLGVRSTIWKSEMPMLKVFASFFFCTEHNGRQERDWVWPPYDDTLDHNQIMAMIDKLKKYFCCAAI